MARPPPEYTRLAGLGQKTVGFLSAGRTRLWLGKDHLLHVTDQWFTETYKRFYFRDIQVLITRKTARGFVVNIVCGILGLLILFFPLAGKLYWSWDNGVLIAGGIGAGIFFIIVLINSILGPTSTCRIRTAVQSEELPSLCRLWRARKVLRILRAKIEEAQGALSQEDVAANHTEILTGETQAKDPPRLSPLPPEPVHHCAGGFHAGLFYFTLADGVLSVIEIFVRSKVVDELSACFTLGGFVCMVVALVKQRRSDLPSRLKNLTWVALAYAVVTIVAGTIYGVVLIIQHPGITTSDLSPFQYPVLMAMYLFSAVGDFIIGGIGAYLLHQFRRESAIAVA